jgi:hypothetical protein
VSENKTGAFFSDNGLKDFTLATGLNFGREKPMGYVVTQGAGNPPAVATTIHAIVATVMLDSCCCRANTISLDLVAVNFSSAMFDILAIQLCHVKPLKMIKRYCEPT